MKDGIALTNTKHPEGDPVPDEIEIKPDSLETVEINIQVMPEDQLETWMHNMIRACNRSTCDSDINVLKLIQHIENLYEKGRADEREACIKLLEDFSKTDMVPAKDTWKMGLIAGANAIRARGKPQRPVKSYTNNSPQYATDDRYTKPQNVYTSEERVQETDKSIHDDDDIQEYKRPWVGLSDEEVAIYINVFNGIRLVREIEAQLKERNT